SRRARWSRGQGLVHCTVSSLSRPPSSSSLPPAFSGAKLRKPLSVRPLSVTQTFNIFGPTTRRCHLVLGLAAKDYRYCRISHGWSPARLPPDRRSFGGLATLRPSGFAGCFTLVPHA